MYTLKQIITLALVGTAIASPVAHRYRQDQDSTSVPESGRLDTAQFYNANGDVVDVVKYIITGGNGQDNQPKPQPAATTPAATQPTPAASSGSGSGSGSGSSSGSTGTGYMAIVSKWRSAGGLSALTQDSKLEANALKTANDGNGQMVHELNPGTMGQVLAPGNSGNFEKVYVGGWLCEIPSLPGLSGVCGSMSQGWSHDGQTGHAEILTSTKYSKIGCALAKGIWACDLA